MINSFELNKFYVMSGNGEKWSDYDGPFNSAQDAFYFLVDIAGSDYSSPELINGSVMVWCNPEDKLIHLVKDDNGVVINGRTVFWKNTVIYSNVTLKYKSSGESNE